MTDYVVTNGRSASYPEVHFGGNIVGARATFCEPSDFAGLSANVLAIPNLPITVLSASQVIIPDRFFGMHVRSRSNDALAGVTAKAVRSHDMENGKGRWQFIQPTANTWDFADLDSWVNTHYAAGRDLVFTLFGTPAWASARATERNAYSDQPGDPSQYNRGIAAEPSDMTTWDTFCTTVATRYNGRIKYYEIWNEPNWHNDGTGPGTNTDCYFTGTLATLSQMVRRANQAIKTVDPTAKIICPPVTSWVAAAGGTAETYFTGMMAASSGDVGNTPMKNWVDIVGVHLYLPTPNRVQDMAGMIDRVNAGMTTAGISGKEIWDTESAPINPDLSGYNDEGGKRIIARMLLTMAAKGIARTFYFQYDDPSMGFTGRPRIIEFRENAVSLLMNGIATVSRFTDGRVAYYSSGAGII